MFSGSVDIILADVAPSQADVVFLWTDLPTLSLWGISGGGRGVSAAGAAGCVRSGGVREIRVLTLARLAQKQGK